MNLRWLGFIAERRSLVEETGGAAGEFGTFLPLTLAAITVGGLAAAPVLAGFGPAYLATAVSARLPVPAQPTKAIVTMLAGAGASYESVAIAGVMLGRRRSHWARAAPSTG